MMDHLRDLILAQVLLSCLDLTFVNYRIVPSYTWVTVENAFGSDHFPILCFNSN